MKLKYLYTAIPVCLFKLKNNNLSTSNKNKKEVIQERKL